MRTFATVASPTAALAALTVLVGQANADLRITKPSSTSNWVVNTPNQLFWAGDSPSPFSVQIINANTSLLTDSLAIANNVDAGSGGIFVTPMDLNPGPGYQIRFYNTSNISDIYATSDVFVLLPVNSSSDATATTGIMSASTASVTGSATAGASTVTAAIPTNATNHLPKSTDSSSSSSSSSTDAAAPNNLPPVVGGLFASVAAVVLGAALL